MQGSGCKSWGAKGWVSGMTEGTHYMVSFGVYEGGVFGGMSSHGMCVGRTSWGMMDGM